MDKKAIKREEVVHNVREMYHRHPFPTLQRKHSYHRHVAYMQRFFAEVGMDPRGKLFGDIACGTGLMLLDYAETFPETQFIGYDISPASVERANRTLREEGITNAQCYIQDIMEMEDRERFDYILSWGTIHHLPDPQEGIRRLCRALKPGGFIRIGVYGYYGNWERRIQQEIIQTLTRGYDLFDFEKKIPVVREWAQGDRNFKNYYTAPPVDLNDDDWVVDEFLHVWENHFRLKDVLSWLLKQGMKVLKMTDYYDQEILLDISAHSASQRFIERVRSLPFLEQCHIIDLIVRPYWISLIAQKPP